ncbi:MAG: ABC transporter substrate-binding protein [Reyranella sp.]|nr:ABC transporter substrate-binding protein [Reyranella sp.]
MTTNRRGFIGGVSAAALASTAGSAWAQTKSPSIYDPGATDTELRIGHFCPYTGPSAEYGAIGKAHEAFWKSVNDKGGINGRKVTFLSRDDTGLPSKSLEVTRELVEQEKVLCLFNPLGTAANTAIQPYMNENKVPQLFVASGSSKWGNPTDFPWTMGFQPDYRFEASAYAKHALATVKDPKFGVLMQNDEYGKDYYAGIRDVVGEDVDVIKVMSYDVTDESIDSKITDLKEFGANVFINISTPKFAVQAIRKAAEIDWKPRHYLNNVSLSKAAVMEPAGFENCQGIISGTYLKDATNRTWDKDAEMKVWRAWMSKYMPEADTSNGYYVFAYAAASLMKETLRKCGNDLTRANVMKQASSLQNVRVPMVLPKLLINTSPTAYYPIKFIQLSQFSGQVWNPLIEFIKNARSEAEPIDEARAPEPASR